MMMITDLVLGATVRYRYAPVPVVTKFCYLKISSKNKTRIDLELVIMRSAAYYYKPI